MLALLLYLIGQLTQLNNTKSISEEFLLSYISYIHEILYMSMLSTLIYIQQLLFLEFATSLRAYKDIVLPKRPSFHQQYGDQEDAAKINVMKCESSWSVKPPRSSVISSSSCNRPGMALFREY